MRDDWLLALVCSRYCSCKGHGIVTSQSKDESRRRLQLSKDLDGEAEYEESADADGCLAVDGC